MATFNLDEHQQSLTDYFASQASVALAYLFGSQARGEAGPLSDVDVAVLNQTPLALRYRVLRDGILLFCRDHQAMIEFKTRTVSEYLDFKPVIERHERAILERARKGELLHGYNPHRGALERYRQLRERLEGTTKADL